MNLDNVPVIVNGTLFYRIVDSYKACFNVAVRASLLSLCVALIFSV